VGRWCYTNLVEEREQGAVVRVRLAGRIDVKKHAGAVRLQRDHQASLPLGLHDEDEPLHCKLCDDGPQGVEEGFATAPGGHSIVRALLTRDPPDFPSVRPLVFILPRIGPRAHPYPQQSCPRGAGAHETRSGWRRAWPESGGSR
jgi:ferredoxin